MNAVEIAVAVVVGLLVLVAAYAVAQKLHWHFVGKARWEAEVAAEETARWEQTQNEIKAAQERYEADLASYERQVEQDRKDAKRAKAKEARIAELNAEYEAVCGWYIGRVVYETDRERQSAILRGIKHQIKMVELGDY